MSDSKTKASRTSIRQTYQEAEQEVCNEALQSGAFDEISDKDWVRMCERVAEGCRESRSDETRLQGAPSLSSEDSKRPHDPSVDGNLKNSSSPASDEECER